MEAISNSNSNDDSHIHIFAPMPHRSEQGLRRSSIVIFLLIFSALFCGTVSILVLKKNNFQFQTLFAVMLPTILIFVILLKRADWKNILKQKAIQEKTEDQYITITKVEISFPNYLDLNNKNKNQHQEDHQFQINRIKDLEQCPGAKYVPSHFRVKYHATNGSTKEYKFQNTLKKEDTKHMFDCLNERSNSIDKQSPFSEYAQSLRKYKRQVMIAMGVLPSIEIGILYFLFLFYSPVFPYSGIITYFSFALPLAFVTNHFIKNNLFSKAFTKGFGKSPHLLLPIVNAFLFSLLFLVTLDLLTKQPVFEGQKIINNKTIKIVQGKNSIYKIHNLQIDLDYPLKFNPFNFNEKILIKTNASTYGKVIINKTQVNFQISEGQLGVPFITKSKVLFDTKLNPKKSTSARIIQLREWVATIPIFKSAKTYIKTHYSNGLLKSKIPTFAGKKHGLATYYHPNAQVYSKINWINGQKHGRYKTYRLDGTLSGDFSLNHGRKHGELLWFNTKGEIKQKAVYDEGKHIK